MTPGRVDNLGHARQHSLTSRGSMMDTLRSASFGTLFGVTFTVSATFQIVLGLIGLLVAMLAPGAFNLNGRPAEGPAEALGALTVMLIVFMLFNAMISSCGAGLWLLVRRVVLKPKPGSQASVF